MTSVNTVGILNLSHDSFSAKMPKRIASISRGRKMLAQEVAFVDIGAQATNPNSQPIHLEEEWRRFLWAVPTLLSEFPGQISIDSFRPQIHRRIAAFNLGEFIINDVTGFNSKAMRDEAQRLKMNVIVSHLPFKFGTNPWAAHKGPLVDNLNVVFRQLAKRAADLEKLGIDRSNIMLDPGIGFGKTMRLNWEILRSLGRLPEGRPIMVGFSHKRFLGTNLATGEPVSKDPGYNERLRYTRHRNRMAAQMAIEAATGRRLYMRVHEPELYSDLVQTD